MRPLMKIVPALATGGVLAALGLTALPMLATWHARTAPTPESVQARMSLFRDFDANQTVAVTPTNVSSVWTASSPIQLSDFIPGTIVVQLRDGAGDADIKGLDSRYGVDLQPNSIEAKDSEIYVARIPSGAAGDNILRGLSSDSRVVVAEPEIRVSIPEGDSVRSSVMYDWTGTGNGGGSSTSMQEAVAQSAAMSSDLDTVGALTAPNDPRYAEQWNFRMIGIEEAWKHSKGKGVVVAVVDTGVAIGPSTKGVPCRDFAQTHYTKGYNFVDNNDDAYDDNAHGTHVAGTIAESTNNNEGVAGIAYEATIMPIKVLSASGSGTAAGVADGIRYAADHGAKVINMSLGSSQSSEVIHNACKYAAKKGVAIVCAAGNGFGGAVGYPAAYPECIAVSSVGPTGKIAKYSSYGKQVALAAPGGDYIDSRDPADGILQNTNFPDSKGGHGDDYYAFQGTSMACPHVAGVAALIEAQGITDPAKVRDILLKSAVANGDPNKYGAGILSASRATERAGQTSAIKLRHLLLFGVGLLTLAVGGTRRRLPLRLVMAGALGLGMFGPDWTTTWVGADSALNLLTFSALVPILAFVALRRGPGVKIAGMLAVGVALNLFANWHNDTLPFTTATFGDSALPWTMANLGATLAIGCAASWRAFRATRTR